LVYRLKRRRRELCSFVVFRLRRLRDYNNDGGDNAINNTSTIQAWDNGLGQRLDRQEYILPAAFANQVLTSVTITDMGNEVLSRAVLAALTVSTATRLFPNGPPSRGSG
jgi:hypothetical protein